MRMHVYLELTEKTKTFSRAHPNLEGARRLNIGTWYKVLKNTALKTPYFPQKSSFIIMPHTRQVNGKDIYTDCLIEALPKKDMLVLYKDWRPSQYNEAYNISGYCLWEALKNKILSVLGYDTYAISSEGQELLSQIQCELKKRLGVDVNLTLLARQRLFNFLIRINAYRHVFKRSCAKVLIVVTSYTHEQAIAAARELGIKVYEMQHGAITPFHLGYSYPNIKNIPYVPDCFVSYGEFWKSNTFFPEGMKHIVVGSRMIENLKKDIDRKAKNQILVISQATVGEQLFNMIIQTALKMPDHKFIYRLHPSENREIYVELLKTSLAQNIIISWEHGITYSLMQTSEVVVGVYSTALIEALALNCRGIIIALSGHEYMENIINRGDAVCVQNEIELVQAIKQGNTANNTEYYYAKDCTEDFINQELLLSKKS